MRETLVRSPTADGTAHAFEVSSGGPRVQANRLTGRGELPARQIVVSSRSIPIAHSVWDAGVYEPHQRFTCADIGERDLDVAASGRKLHTAFAAPREHHSTSGPKR